MRRPADRYRADCSRTRPRSGFGGDETARPALWRVPHETPVTLAPLRLRRPGRKGAEPERARTSRTACRVGTPGRPMTRLARPRPRHRCAAGGRTAGGADGRGCKPVGVPDRLLRRVHGERPSEMVRNQPSDLDPGVRVVTSREEEGKAKAHDAAGAALPSSKSGRMRLGGERSGTSFALTGSTAANLSRASCRASRSWSDPPAAAAPLLPPLGPGRLDQDASHRLGGCHEEVPAVGERAVPVDGEPQVRFADEGGRVEVWPGRPRATWASTSPPSSAYTSVHSRTAASPALDGLEDASDAAHRPGIGCYGRSRRAPPAVFSSRPVTRSTRWRVGSDFPGCVMVATPKRTSARAAPGPGSGPLVAGTGAAPRRAGAGTLGRRTPGSGWTRLPPRRRPGG